MLAGGLGGWWDTGVMRFVDILLSIPSLLLAVSIAAVLGRNPWAIMIAIGVAQVPIFARLLRGSMLGQRGQDYVLAASSLGLRQRRIVMSHVLPNSVGPLIVQATLVLATATIEVAALSYLGLGQPDPAVAEWGRMLVKAQDRLQSDPRLAILPGICMAITALRVHPVRRGPARGPGPEVEAMIMSETTLSRGRPRPPVNREETLLEVDDLSVTFARKGSKPVHAVDGVSFDVRPGQVVGIVGESGSGKSVTLAGGDGPACPSAGSGPAVRSATAARTCSGWTPGR